MKTITDCVHQLVKYDPFLEDALARGIINFSALAEDLHPKIVKKLRKEIQLGSIVMALRRYQPTKAPNPLNFRLGDVVMRSDITDFTFVNSTSLLGRQSAFLDAIKNQFGAYFTYSNNDQESSVIVMSALEPLVVEHFDGEACIARKTGLSTLSIKLPESSSAIVGLYYHVFRLLAYEGIPIFETVSTSNYFTLLFEKSYLNQAFVLINEIKETGST